MTIGPDSLKEFFGTLVPLANTSALVASGNFSIAGDLLDWTNSDDVKEASITLEVTMATAAADNSGCYMYFRKLDVEGTNDDAVPTAVYRQTPIAFFPIAPVPATTIQRSTVRIFVPNYKSSSKFEIYFENQTQQQIDAGWKAWVMPITPGPKPA